MKNKNWAFILFTTFCLVCMSPFPVNASYDFEHVYRVKFAPGTSGAVIDGTAIRYSRNIYLLGARAGQVMNVKITAMQDNAVFTIQDPKKRFLKGAAQFDDVTTWRGRLPLSGDYRINVSAARANAHYKMLVMIN